MAGSRYYSDTVLKKLFALSRNRCAFPSCEELLSKPEWPKVLAKVCHICGLNAGSARHDRQMTDGERNDYPNLILLCPNHHELIDELEPERWSVDDLCDMKAAHESHRPGDHAWCPVEVAQQFVLKLALAQELVVLGPGQQPPREPIRSGARLPEQKPPAAQQRESPTVRGREFEPVNPDWPRGPKRVRDLANEVGMTQRALLELCEALGIPARSKDTKLPEPYADMVRRRVRRGGLGSLAFNR